MEIVAELVIFLLQCLAEFLLQIIFEALVELGLHAAREPFRLPTPNPWFAGIGYLVLGAVGGAISVLIFPSAFITSDIGRIANVFATPILAGLTMVAFGAWRQRRGEEMLRIDRFFYGFIFALAMALVRFSLTHG
ncbi:hypothetical protein [Undibacterium terreum]|uniref:Uncharacterized protein n=1 Tax=Undibacterium terreum TaxID=1224302 RepID=A0A916UA26_9BURK|nr:hypothetical protein [Undibacterium terreum]GGC64620.1 hypothetical protein GCM10011396_09510 [Undibacterium terreum]